MSDANPSVLVIDDEEFNLELISEYLSTSEINSVCASNGAEALEILHKSPDLFSAVLLDRMMPGMDGMEVLSKIKADTELNRLPVIMQTAKVGSENMRESLEAGAHYYITKPYDQQTLLAIVTTAVKDYQYHVLLQSTVKQSAQTLKLMNRGEFRYRTLDDGKNLALLLANACPDPDKVVLGLTELMINAIEHGNLGISYEEKSKLNLTGAWEQEVNRRLESSEYSSKYVLVNYEELDREIEFTIIDQGAGFDWHEYLEMSPQRAFDSHGRGIAMANTVSFNRIDYRGHGNEVRVTVEK